MPKTKKQAGEDALALASNVREAGKAVGDYLYANWKTLTAAQRTKLGEKESELLAQARSLVTDAVEAALVAGQQDLDSLNAATKTATDAIARIDSAKKAIKIATAVVGLAAAVATGQWSQIKPGIEAVLATT